MSDERLRELERKWQATGDSADLKAWLHGFKRTAPSFQTRLQTEWCFWNGVLTQPGGVDPLHLSPRDCIIFTTPPCPTDCYLGDGRFQGLPDEPPSYDNASEALASSIGVPTDDVRDMFRVMQEMRANEAERGRNRRWIGGRPPGPSPSTQLFGGLSEDEEDEDSDD